MKETCCQFGPQRQLAGVVTEPAGPARRVACVLVNAGLVPKFGPYRLYTRLARRLAQEGYITLRFDLGGIGDSPPMSTGQPLDQRTALEIEAAIAQLSQRYALDGVVLGGLCSGAADSLRYAERDPRVTGVVLIDPFAYETRQSRWRYFMLRAAGRALRMLGLYQPRPRSPINAAMGRHLVEYAYMEKAESSRILRTLIARGARTHFVYTGGMRRAFNHESQLQAMFEGIDFKGLVTVDHFPHTDHTQLLEEDREALVEAISRRLLAASLGAVAVAPYSPSLPA